MSSTGSATPAPVHRLPVVGALRLGRPSDVWFKPALSVVAAVAPPSLLLVALGRLDLAAYTMAGSLCALYAHNRPYAARAKVLAWVLLGMLGGLAAALAAASLTRDAVVLVTVGALLAAVQKAVCDATRVGPPAHVILTFVSSATLFVPQTLGQVPGHLALAAGAARGPGWWAWPPPRSAPMARNAGPPPRPSARPPRTPPLRRAGGEGAAGTRSAAYAAVHAAWQTLLAAGTRPSTTRDALERLVVRAEMALAAPTDADPALLHTWARAVRGTGRIPRTGDPRREDEVPPRTRDLSLGERDELLGVDAERDVPPRPLWTRLEALAPVALRTALGCALAGYAALALGAERPYWALVTAASLYQVNVTLTWSRAVQRVVGNLVGVLLFAVVTPVAQLGPLALVLCILACNFGAEALIGRNYWLGSVCVTPLALLVTELPGHQPTGELVTGRVVDTLVGALVGFAAAVAVTDRRAGRRVERALTAVDRAREHAARLVAASAATPAALEAARRGLAAAVVDLRATADAAAGEWWQRALPQERVVLAEQAAHRTLAATVRRQGLLPTPAPARTRTRRAHRHDGDPRAIGRRRCRHAGHLEHHGHVRLRA